MPVGYPPQPVYPFAIDSDRTLYLVYNTSEAALAVDNSAWSDEIEIVPVGDDDEEQWGENGFANIDGELLYYDAVQKNDAGKIFKFKRVARSVGGSKTKFNSAGAIIRGFVIAEHHNQLADAIILTERYILGLRDEIIDLVDEPPCIDDAFCPEIDFKFEIDDTATSNCEGISTNYEIVVIGDFSTFRLDFGDGQSTTSERIGTHVYPPNSTIDPVVTVTNSRCSIIQTPITRNEPSEPTTGETDTTFNIPIPAPPDFPLLELPDIDIPIPQIEFPQIVFPCLDVGPIGPIAIPSVIIIEPPINIPSVILFGPVDIPSIILFGPAPSFSPIEFGPAPSFSPIGFGPAPSFAPIEFGPAPSFSPIEFGPAPSFSPIEFGPSPSFSPIEFGPAPSFTPIDFGPAPSFSPIEFGPAPSFSPIEFGPAPSFSPIEFGPAPSFSPISFGPAPSFSPIEFGPAPSFSPIEFGPAPSISPISFGPAPSISPISFGPAPSISPISFGPAPSISPISFGPAPTVSVDWGTPPTLTCTVTVECPSSTPLMMRAQNNAVYTSPKTFKGDKLGFMGDSLNPPSAPAYEIDVEDLGIPREIKVIAPKFPDIRLLHDLPTTLQLEVPNIPNIKLEITNPIPSEVKIVSEAVIPERIILETGALSSVVKEISQLFGALKIEFPELPSVIRFEGHIPDTIQVKGIPETIEVKMPSEIVARLEMPEGLEVPLVYKGGPVPIQFDTSNLFGNSEHPCFALVPCDPKK